MTIKIITSLFFGLIAVGLFSQEIEWKSKAELPDKIYSGSAVTCQDRIYFLGGQIDLGSTEYIKTNRLYEYKLNLDEWIEKPNMPTSRFNMAACAIEGKIYAIGGDRFRNKNEMYDPTTETWQALAFMPTARQHIKAAVVDNKIYIIGGLESWSIVSVKNEVYDPLTNTWEEMAPIPTPKHNYATAVYHNKIYIFGGSTQIGADVWVKTRSVEVYDPATNTWDTSPSLPSVRFNPGIGLINDKIVIVGGIENDEVTSGIDLFDPVTGLWSSGVSLPEKNVAMGSTVLNNKIYIIGGTEGPSDWIGYNTVYEGCISDTSVNGIDQINTKDGLFIFPNPAKNYIQIHISEPYSKINSFQILTIKGDLIKEGKLESERIDISDLNKGVFLLNIKTDKKIFTKKIVKE